MNHQSESCKSPEKLCQVEEAFQSKTNDHDEANDGEND
jgi:hypothetical protein